MFESMESPAWGAEERPSADALQLDPFTGLPLHPRPAPVALLEATDERAHPTEACAAPPVHPLVAQLQEALAALARAQAAGELADGSLPDTAALLRAAESAKGLALVSLAGVDRHKAFLAAGRASAAGWLGAVLRVGDASARCSVALARRLTQDLAPLGDLLVDGGTTVAHCAAVSGGLRGIGPEVVAESLPALVVLARTLDPPTLSRELRERAHAVSDELAKEQARHQRERTGLTATELPDGCVAVHGLLGPETGQALLLALDSFVHGDRRARQEDGETDDRDASTRRADALGALAQHALGCPGLLPGQGGSRAQLLVLCPAETLGGTPGATPATFPGSNALLTRDQLLRLACDADVSRVVLDGDGQVLDLGRTTRTVSPAQWRALVARDRHCVVRGCRRRPTECQAHHVHHWALGGASDLANYALVCHLHHHQLHEGARRLPHRDGRWLTPDGYEQRESPPLLARSALGLRA